MTHRGDICYDCIHIVRFTRVVHREFFVGYPAVYVIAV
jgi:hypothetical protein